MTKIGNVNTEFLSNTNTAVQTESETATNKPVLNTIFDIDALGNGDGNLEEQDFTLALSNDKYKDLKTKIEDFYVEFAGKNLGKTQEVGDYLITEVDLPLQPKGVTNRRKIVKDKTTGEIVMDSSTTITEGEDGVITVKTHKNRYNNSNIS